MSDLIKSGSGSLSASELTSASDFAEQWNQVDLLLTPDQRGSKYRVAFASSDRCMEKVFRLRYEVFNIELNEGLPESHITGLDQDEFDPQMAHLVLVENATGEIVGTYRLQTMQQALAARGIYSQREYDLTALRPWFGALVECGRACIAIGHRSPSTVIQLWAGIGEFMKMFGCRWLFGCCSLTSRNPNDGWRALKTIRSKGYLHPELMLPPHPAYTCGPAAREHDPAIGPPLKLPKLFSAYMRMGSKVISEPALDREFGTVDFLILLDAVQNVNYSSLDML